MGNTKSTPLTDTEIKNAKPKEKKYTLSDGNGLQLLIKPDGKKIWEIRFTVDGKAKTTTAGSYPAVTLAQARIVRNEYKSKAANGIDPIQERKESKVVAQAHEARVQELNDGQFHLVTY